MTTLRIGYSPCPNDTFIMAALAQGRIESPLRFEPFLADVETLNQMARQQALHVTKLSFMALGLVRDAYALLHAGAALGRGCGPLVVARPGRRPEELAHGVIAAPGALTTANLLLGLYLGRAPQVTQMVFSDIMPAVADGRCDFGVVIHEGRFTFEGYGLTALLDLGEWWEHETGRPIPLGGIAIRRDFGEDIARLVDRAIRDSLESAPKNSAATTEYVLSHAQEMDSVVVDQHIRLYVNDFSQNLGPEGEAAVNTLFTRAEAARILPASRKPLMAYTNARSSG